MLGPIAFRGPTLCTLGVAANLVARRQKAKHRSRISHTMAAVRALSRCFCERLCWAVSPKHTYNMQLGCGRQGAVRIGKSCQRCRLQSSFQQSRSLSRARCVFAYARGARSLFLYERYRSRPITPQVEIKFIKGRARARVCGGLCGRAEKERKQKTNAAFLLLPSPRRPPRINFILKSNRCVLKKFADCCPGAFGKALFAGVEGTYFRPTRIYFLETLSRK